MLVERAFELASKSRQELLCCRSWSFVSDKRDMIAMTLMTMMMLMMMCAGDAGVSSPAGIGRA